MMIECWCIALPDEGRSTATAMGILIQHGMSVTNAYAYVADCRSPLIIHPNRKIIKYVDERFKLNGKFVDLVAELEQYPHLFDMTSGADD